MKDDKSFPEQKSLCLPSTLGYLFHDAVEDQAFSIFLLHYPYRMIFILMVAGDLLCLQPSHLLSKQEDGRRAKGLLPSRSSSYQT